MCIDNHNMNMFYKLIKQTEKITNVPGIIALGN